MRKQVLALSLAALIGGIGFAAAASAEERNFGAQLQATAVTPTAEHADLAATAAAAAKLDQVVQESKVDQAASVPQAAASGALCAGPGDVRVVSAAIPGWPPSERMRTRDEPTHRVSGLNPISLASQHARTAPAWRPSS